MKKIFDQEQPKSSLAQSLNAAFAGCDTWTIAPPKRRAVSIPPPRRAHSTSTPADRYF